MTKLYFFILETHSLYKVLSMIQHIVGLDFSYTYVMSLPHIDKKDANGRHMWSRQEIHLKLQNLYSYIDQPSRKHNL